jgi:small subunit ribosomal protein S2
MMMQSLKIVKEIAKNNGRILFVATKKQASDPIAESAKRCGQYYVNFRWLGGMLTNWKTVSQSIKTLQKIEEQLADTEVGYSKKEKLDLQRSRNKLEQNLGGIKNMGGYPDLVFVIDTNKEALAIAEAKKLNIPVMAIVDTNCNPEVANYVIPGNDDSAKSIRLYCRLISDAIISGIKENLALSGVDINKFDGDNFSAGLKELKKSENKKFDKFDKIEKKDSDKKKSPSNDQEIEEPVSQNQEKNNEISQEKLEKKSTKSEEKNHSKKTAEIKTSKKSFSTDEKKFDKKNNTEEVKIITKKSSKSSPKK